MQLYIFQKDPTSLSFYCVVFVPLHYTGCLALVFLATEPPPPPPCPSPSRMANYTADNLIFDTLDHSIMLSRLCDMYGIQGDALEWLRSYLDHRSQCVKLLGTESTDKILTFAMPQGSVLGAEFYCYYVQQTSRENYSLP